MTKQESNNQELPSDAVVSIREQLEIFFKEYGLDQAGLALYYHIIGGAPSDDTDYSFGHLKLVMARAIKSDIDDTNCFRVINYFTGGQSRLLDVLLTFVDPESNVHHALSKEEAKLMLFSGEFYHPQVPDELVENCKEHILVSYKPSVIATQIRRKAYTSNGESS